MTLILLSQAGECPNRIIQCQYCQLDCLASNIERHRIACGSRTEKCDVCSNYFLVRSMEDHMNLHKTRQPEPVAVPTANPSFKPKTTHRNVALQSLMRAREAAGMPRDPEPPVMQAGIDR